MKRIFTVALVALSVLMVSSVVFAAKKGDASMKFEETTHDFGTIKEKGGPVECEFPFVNDGESNLVIISASAQCGCTRPSFPKKPVGPGKKGVIKVTYNPLGRPGAFTKTVTIKTNGKPGTVRLKIRGTVMPESK